MEAMKSNEIDALFFDCLYRDYNYIHMFGITNTYPPTNQMEEKYEVEDVTANYSEIDCDGDYRYEPIEDCYRELIEDRMGSMEA